MRYEARSLVSAGWNTFPSTWGVWDTEAATWVSEFNDPILFTHEHNARLMARVLTDRNK